MRSSVVIYLFIFIFTFTYLSCQTKQFNPDFFAKYVPEFPDARLMNKLDIPPHQREFFDEAHGKLLLECDLNNNGLPEQIICGLSSSMLRQGEKGPYFLSIFEIKGNNVKRLCLHKLLVPPVSLDISKNTTRKGVLVLFAFYSDYAVEIYFEDNEYHLEKMF